MAGQMGVRNDSSIRPPSSKVSRSIRLDPVVVPIKSIFALSADPSLTSWTRESTQTESVRALRGRMGLRSFTWRPFLKGPATDTTMAHKWPFVASSSAPRRRAVTNALSTLALRPPTSSVPPLLLVPRSLVHFNERQITRRVLCLV